MTRYSFTSAVSSIIHAPPPLVNCMNAGIDKIFRLPLSANTPPLPCRFCCASLRRRRVPMRRRPAPPCRVPLAEAHRPLPPRSPLRRRIALCRRVPPCGCPSPSRRLPPPFPHGKRNFLFCADFGLTSRRKYSIISLLWGYSAVGSAFEWHSKGHGFDSH